MPPITLGDSIPPDTAHAVSVSLPTWSANVGYEEGADWVLSRLSTGYPRFFVHNSIKAFAASIASRYGDPSHYAGQAPVAMLFPSRPAAARCVAFMHKHAASPSLLAGLVVVHLGLDPAAARAGTNTDAAFLQSLAPTISAVLMHPDAFPVAKQYWQHSGDGVSSRRAESCHKLFSDGLLVRQLDEAAPVVPSAVPAGIKPVRGPKRYRKTLSQDSSAATPRPSAAVSSPAAAATVATVATVATPAPANGDADDEDVEIARFLEERFGRNLNLSFVQRATSAIRRRITGAMTADLDADAAPLPEQNAATAAKGTTEATGTAGPDRNLRGLAAVCEDDVFLFPCGMNAIFHAHRFLLAARPDFAACCSINYGFPYVDTLKILQKFGAGCLFYGRASTADLDDLEARLVAGERFLALFCEFPGNPLLTCPDLVRIRRLADAYDFAVVVDETVGTFANINVLPYADVVVSSLTKIFSGDCNVMGGSLVLNRGTAGCGGGTGAGRYYSQLRAVMEREYDPHAYWAEDVVFMERNSRDFAARIGRINANADAICRVLRASPLIRSLYYPRYVESHANYDAVRIPHGGYGGLLSFVFHHKAQAVAFFDAVETAKGPSLGTNFTLTSPYVILAHYQELDWCASLGVDPNLIRVSVGLEDTAALCRSFETALAAAAAVVVEEAKPAGTEERATA